MRWELSSAKPGSTTPTSNSMKITCAVPIAITADTAIPKWTSRSTGNRTKPTSKRRRQLVWEIERKLAEDGSRSVIFYAVSAACAQPYFKGHTIMVNSVYNGWRMEEVWLDK